MTAWPGDQWQISKPAEIGRGGAIACQHPEAAAIGAAMLADGGNAMDAALAAAFALTVAEPWMSGLGGAGIILVQNPAQDRIEQIDFPALAPQGLDPARYPLLPDAPDEQAMFDWPPVAGAANRIGPLSIAVPGSVAGFGLAATRHASRPWAELLAPAIALARRGMVLDWFAALSIAIGAADLARFPSSAAQFLPGGLPPMPAGYSAPRPMALGAMADSLARLAEAGPTDFYRGDLARELLADLTAFGSPLNAADLADYQAQAVTPLRADYRGHHIHLPAGLTGGVSVARILTLLAEAPLSLAAQARALRTAFAERLAGYGHDRPGSCTTHLSVIDRNGMMVALTNTLVGRFGSALLLPRTGLMLNNAIFWFDPRTGGDAGPNALAPGARPLANMSPALITGPDGAGWASLGASGGRSIIPAVAQIAARLIDSEGADPAATLATARLDLVRGRELILPADVLAGLTESLRAELAPISPRPPAAYPTGFATPSLVVRRHGLTLAAADPRSPWASAQAVMA